MIRIKSGAMLALDCFETGERTAEGMPKLEAPWINVIAQSGKSPAFRDLVSVELVSCGNLGDAFRAFRLDYMRQYAAEKGRDPSYVQCLYAFNEHLQSTLAGDQGVQRYYGVVNAYDHAGIETVSPADVGDRLAAHFGRAIPTYLEKIDEDEPPVEKPMTQRPGMIVRPLDAGGAVLAEINVRPGAFYAGGVEMPPSEKGNAAMDIVRNRCRDMGVEPASYSVLPYTQYRISRYELTIESRSGKLKELGALERARERSSVYDAARRGYDDFVFPGAFAITSAGYAHNFCMPQGEAAYARALLTADAFAGATLAKAKAPAPAPAPAAAEQAAPAEDPDEGEGCSPGA
jgi:hypothetical protein